MSTAARPGASQLWHFSAGEVAGLVRSGKVSAREVADAALQRLDSINPRINAIVDCRPDLVRQQADQVDSLLARGNDPGPLAGVPITLKINIDQVGFATSDGSRLRKDWVAKFNSPVVDNLVRNGAVLLGRSNSPTFALRWFTSNVLYGSTRNPRDPLLTPGGSSGGAAAAVATGIGHIAVGTDVGGSVRYPAYACGVHGIRPSLGRVPAYNASSPEDTIGLQIMHVKGPIARTVQDLRLSLAAMSGADPRDPWSVPAPLEGPPMPLRAALCVRPGGIGAGKTVCRRSWERFGTRFEVLQCSNRCRDRLTPTPLRHRAWWICNSPCPPSAPDLPGSTACRRAWWSDC